MTVSFLLDCFAKGHQIIVNHLGLPRMGTIDMIQREDGSGLCYNVKLYGYDKWIFVRCDA